MAEGRDRAADAFGVPSASGIVGGLMGPGGHFTVVTLPAYKAEDTLEQTIGALPEGSADHLLLVDDASPDGTVDVARRLGIDVRVHDRNRGYGGNQKTCYREALDLGATVIVLLHPDYQYDPTAVPALVAPIVAGVADFTFGSRFACTGNPRAGGMPLYRYWGNRSNVTNWPVTSARWLRDCESSQTGVIRVTTEANVYYELPCSNLRR